jgi:ankyrin repeat protein
MDRMGGIEKKVEKEQPSSSQSQASKQVAKHSSRDYSLVNAEDLTEAMSGVLWFIPSSVPQGSEYAFNGKLGGCEKGTKNENDTELVLPEPSLTAQEQFFSALKIGNEDISLELLKNIDCNFRDKQGNTLVHSACYSNCYQVIEKLMDENISVNVQNYDGETPLHIACIQSVALVRILIKNGASVNVKNNKGATPLNKAHLDSAKVVKRLIDAGAEVNTKDINGDTPLHKACSNDISILKELLIHKPDINAVNNDGETPLLLTCSRFGLSEKAEALLQSGADFTIAGKNGNLPYDRASEIHDFPRRIINKMKIRN